MEVLKITFTGVIIIAAVVSACYLLYFFYKRALVRIALANTFVFWIGLILGKFIWSSGHDNWAAVLIVHSIFIQLFLSVSEPWKNFTSKAYSEFKKK